MQTETALPTEYERFTQLMNLTWDQLYALALTLGLTTSHAKPVLAVHIIDEERARGFRFR